MVQQAQNVVDHFEAVSLRVAGLTARAVTAQIHRDNVIRSAELVEEPAVDPSRTDAEDEAVQQDHGLAFARNDVANVDAVGVEIARLGTHGFHPPQLVTQRDVFDHAHVAAKTGLFRRVRSAWKKSHSNFSADELKDRDMT